MYRVDIAKGASEDFRSLLQTDPEAAKLIHAVLEQIDTSSPPPENLLFMSDKYYRYETFSVRFFQEAYNLDGLRLWSIKCYWNVTENDDLQESLHYRVLMAPNHKEKRYFILGILSRRNSYDTSTQKYQRIKSDYDRLGCES